MIGSDASDFKGAELQSIPVKPFTGEPNDDVLVNLQRYLLSRIIPCSQNQGSLKQVVYEDFHAL